MSDQHLFTARAFQISDASLPINVSDRGATSWTSLLAGAHIDPEFTNPEVWSLLLGMTPSQAKVCGFIELIS